MSSVAVKSVSICIKMIGCATKTMVSVIISMKKISTTIPKKAFAAIRVGFVATETVCDLIMPKGPKRTMVFI